MEWRARGNAHGVLHGKQERDIPGIVSTASHRARRKHMRTYVTTDSPVVVVTRCEDGVTTLGDGDSGGGGGEQEHGGDAHLSVVFDFSTKAG